MRIGTTVVGLLLGITLATGPAMGQGLTQGLFVAAQKGQTQQEQERDEYECYKWAVAQSGVDPTAPAQGPDRGQRARSTAGGAARGAALGAGVGAIAGNAGKGAAAGAAVGGVGGRRRGVQQEKAQVAGERNAYHRAFAACMEARDYTVR